MKVVKQGRESRSGKLGLAPCDPSLRSASELAMAAPANSVTLVSVDGDSFVVEASSIVTSQLIKVMVDGEKNMLGRTLHWRRRQFPQKR